MALPHVSVGQFIEPADWNNLVDAINALADPARAAVFNNGTQAVADSTWTAVLFGSESYDTAGMHSTASNTSRLVAPADGTYHVSAQISFAASNVGARKVRFLKAGGTVDVGGGVIESACGAGEPTMLSTSMEVQLLANEYVEAYVWQSSGGSLNMGDTTGALYCRMQMRRVA